VALDLAGHTITGPAPAGSGSTGVAVLPNRTGVTVRNGVIRGFDAGVDVQPGGNGAVVTGLILDANGTGIRVSGGTVATRLADNSIVNTVSFSGIQLGGNRHLVENNLIFRANGAGVSMSGNDDIVRGNTMSDTGQNGINLGAFPGNPGPFFNNQLLNNTINGAARVGNATSISLSNGSGTRIAGNLINGRRVTPGIFVLDSVDTVVSGNTLTNNASTGVLVRGTSRNTQVLANQSSSNSFSGISIESGPTQTLVADNIVQGNGSNGIDVRSASTRVARNTALFNGVWGIFAVTGVTDGGGNTAVGNGNPAQCTANILCN